MKIDEVEGLDWFERILTSFGFESYEPFVLCSVGIVASFLFGAFKRVQADDDQAAPLSPFEILFQTLGLLTVTTLLTRHVALLIGYRTLPFDVLITIALSSSVLLGSTLATRSGLSIILAFAFACLSAALRFIGPGQVWAEQIEEWMVSFFPYDVTAAKISTGMVAFLFTGVYALYFIRRFNEARKAAVEKGKNIGIDTEALEKLAFGISGIVGLVFAMLVTGVSLPTISLVTGILAAGIGFAAKDVLSNIAAGIVLIWDGSFKVGDVISMDGGGYGQIEKLTLRHAIIRDRDEMSILIPYTRLVNTTIQNWTHDDQTRVRLKIDIGIDYGTEDIEVARNALIRAALKPDRVDKSKPPRVNLMAAGESAIQLQLRFWIEDPENGIRNIMSEVLEGMIRELKAADVKIPFNTIDLNLRSFPRDIRLPKSD